MKGAQAIATGEPASPTPVEVVGGLKAAATMLKPLRLEILESLSTPDSATGLARRLGLPRQRVNYHLRELERAGLLRCVEERQKGNCVERLYRASARHYLIGPRALGRVAPPDPPAREPARGRERFSWAYLVAVLGKALRDLAALRGRADRAGQPLATFGLQTEVRFRSPRALDEFTRKLAREVARLVSEYHDESAPAGRSYQLFLGSYPTLTTKERRRR